MLVEFSVANFRSINEMQTISFVATGLKSSDDNADVDKNNIVEVGGHRLLKTVGIYGANASGKSNILKAFEEFINIVKRDPSPKSNLSDACQPFLYQESPEKTDAYFQIVLLIDGKKYRYGITLKKNPETGENLIDQYSNEVITSEWLYGTKEKNSREVFVRIGNVLKVNSLSDSATVPPIPYSHSLFLTHAAAFSNSGECTVVRNFLSAKLKFFRDDKIPYYRAVSVWNILRKNKDTFLKFLASFNLQYDDIEIKFDKDELDYLVPAEKINFKKRVFTSNNSSNVLNLNLKTNESKGTQKLFNLAGFLLSIFDNSFVSRFIAIDEIDSNFHPALLRKLIESFNDPSINKTNSQLLFSSHDTNLMSPTIMRRDQFYFTEKTETESTKLYALSDLKGVRNNADFAKHYLAGYYGAVPVLHRFITEEK